ncbi:putative calcium-binding protein CML16 [Panicum miliaceum]|uniref:Calcium-binding protein CML16 n=1 Tax=Panicum miliaceum TaxID=4540 RepID=A0A3L6SKG5_PANMI|nr:putative calcium-binding protein CML16 [Panicum miliaceum]
MSNGTEKQAQAAAAAALRQRPPAVSAEMQKVFSRFDADGDGRISPSELAAVSRAISPPPSSSHGGREVAAMMDELDTDRDGYVDLGEFAAFHSRAGRGDDGELEAELRAAFDVYDVNGDGRITAAELGKVLAQIGEGCSAEECERMIASVDVDGDGCVGFEEFKKMMAPQGSAAAPGGDVPDKAKKE